MAVLVHSTGGKLSSGSPSGTDYEQLVNYTMLYDSGNECEAVGGGIENEYLPDGSYTGTHTYTENADNIHLTLAKYGANCARTKNKVDITEYSKMFAKYTTTYSSSYTNCAVCAMGVLGTLTYSEIKNKEYDTIERTQFVNGVDISEESGEQYVYICTFNGDAYATKTLTLYDMFLVKPDDFTTLCQKAGITAPNTIEELIADTEALTAIFNSEAAVKFMIKQCTGDFMVGVLNDETAVGLLAESPYLNKVIANPHWAKFMMMLPTAQSLLNYTMLYDSGNECEAITGGWVKTYLSNGSGGTATKNADNLYTISSSSSSYNNCGFATANGIDDTDQTFNMIAIYTEYTEAYSCNGTGNLGSVQTSGVCVEAGTVTEKTLVRKESTIGGLHLFLSSGKTSRKQYYYNVFLSKADNFTEWASKADITASDLDTLLADSTAMATLMSNQEAVDYLAGCTGDLMLSILNSTVAVSAITGSTIAVQRLTEHPAWKKFIDMIPTSIDAGLNLV